MIQKVIQILCEVKDAPELISQLTPNSSIVDDVGLDSLLMINFILAIEEAFEIEIDFDEFDYEHLNSIQTFYDFLTSTKEGIR